MRGTPGLRSWLSMALAALLVVGSSSPGLAQDSIGSGTYVMQNVNAGESISKADGVITSSAGFTSTTVTGQSVNPASAGSGSFALNGDSGGGGGALVSPGSGGGGGGGGCFAGGVGGTGLPACAALLAAGLTGLLIRRRKV
ncbi:MAG: hypothetical protein HYY93_05820 [Planctomycetes bacterium]|nr:hypothetical protein [Planctomycetota bacterium]